MSEFRNLVHRKPEVPRLSREEYVKMIQEGYEFRPGCLYEADQNPKAKFVIVNLGPAAPASYKRIIKEPKS